MVDSEGGGDRQGFLAVGNGCRFFLHDLVDVFVGTASNIRGNKTIAFRGRFKGVKVEGAREVFGTTYCRDTTW